MAWKKEYINGIYVSEKEFDNGGSVLELTLDMKKLDMELAKFVNEKGRVYLKIAKMKVPFKDKDTGKITKTHYVYTSVKDDEIPDRPPILPGSTVEDDDPLPF